MLRNTFCHLSGIGLRTERALWDGGVRNWEDLVEMGEVVLPGKRGQVARDDVFRSIEALEDRDIGFFGSALPPGEQWRMFADFRGRVAYLDIETTGLGFGDGITTIALYDGTSVRHYVQGESLRRFKDDVDDYELLITYNGKCFDIPFIEQYFMMSLPHAHIDLRYVLRGLGYSGGLKACERALGIDRGDLDGVDGYFAVLLWQEYERFGNQRALETLLAYNIEDVLNLERLMLLAFNMKLGDTPFAHTGRLPIPSDRPRNPFVADLETVDMIRARMPVSGYGF